MHNPEYLWADAYSLFERLMNLGVKELYYKEEVKKSRVVEETKESFSEMLSSNPLKNIAMFNTINNSNTPSSSDNSVEFKEKQQR